MDAGAVDPRTKRTVALLHAAYWALYLLLLAVVFAVLRVQFPQKPSLITILLASRAGLMSIAPNVIAFYASYWILFPRFLERRRVMALLLTMAAVCTGSTAAGLLIVRLLFGASQPVFANPKELGSLTAVLIAIGFIHSAIALVMRGFIGWYGEMTLREELGRKTHAMEMALLRSRIDPHFLFNTLNNIDVLIARDPSAASAYLNKLCDIMRFVLYETSAPTIPLAAELQYIEKYIDLERIRSANPRYVRYEIAGDPSGLRIAPMIFIPFIENAFKHAASRKQGDVITVRVSVENSRITFQCSNRYRNGTKNASSGLGDELIRRRLTLLYPDRHHLDVVRHHDLYTLNLSVDLDASPLRHH
jgi:hypothetical protein